MANLEIRRIQGAVVEQGIDREDSESKKDRSAAQEKDRSAAQECSTGKGKERSTGKKGIEQDRIVQDRKCSGEQGKNARIGTGGLPMKKV